jgi:hypothetical protein
MHRAYPQVVTPQSGAAIWLSASSGLRSGLLIYLLPHVNTSQEATSLPGVKRQVRARADWGWAFVKRLRVVHR